VTHWLDELGLEPQKSITQENKAPNKSIAQHYSIFTTGSQAQKNTITQLEAALSSRGLGDIHFVEIL